MSKPQASAIRSPLSRRATPVVKALSDKIKLVNIPDAFDSSDLVREAPMETARYRDVLVTRRLVVNSADGVKFASMSEWYEEGAIYGGDGDLLPEFLEIEESSRGRRRNPPRVDPSDFRDAPVVSEPCVYLGTLHGHFGHFLVESLARAWIFGEADRPRKVVFHYAAGGGKSFAELSRKIAFPPFVLATFGALGLEPDDIVLANCDMRIEDLRIPTAQFSITDWAAAGMPVPYDLMRERFLSESAGAQHPKKVYLTRRELKADQAHQVTKSISNEAEIEQIFIGRGYVPVSMQKMSFAEQARLISGATHIAGPTGSALHMALFNGRPDTTLVALDWRNSRTQYVIDAVRGLNSCHVGCLAGRDAMGAPILDADVITYALDLLDDGFDALGSVASVAPSPAPEAIEPLHEPSDDLGAAALATWRRHRDRCPPAQRLGDAVAMALFVLDAAQRADGVTGDLLDVGSSSPHMAGALSAAAAGGERVIVVGEAAGPRLRQVDKAKTPPGRTAELTADLASRCRILHLDGSGRYANFAADLALAADAAGDAAVILIDDFYQAAWPEVSAAVFALLARNTEWSPLLIGAGKIALARRARKPALISAVAGAAETARRFAGCMMQPSTLNGEDVFVVRPMRRSAD